MTAGRPSKYSEAYCNEVIETMATGLSLTAFAGEIGVARSTINEWMAAHPEFSEAVKVGQAKRVQYLERTMLDGDAGPRVTARIFALKNADPEEWRDRKSLDHTSSDGSMTPKGLDASKLSTDALREIMAAKGGDNA